MYPKTQTLLKRYRLRSTGLPLAVYREVVAHLCQVEGIETGLVPQSSQCFDYSQSQVDSLSIQHAADVDPAAQQQVEEILAYYGDRFAPWETVES